MKDLYIIIFKGDVKLFVIFVLRKVFFLLYWKIKDELDRMLEIGVIFLVD